MDSCCAKRTLTGLVEVKGTSGSVPYTGIVSNDASLDYMGQMTQC
jgi:hypothetical protein